MTIDQSTRAGAPAGTAGTASADGIKPLPVWFFGFEAILASAYDIVKAYPKAMYVLGALVLLNLILTATVLSSRVKLARRLWRSKGTRKVAIALVVLRVGSHFVMGALGTQVNTPAEHISFAVGMAVLTVWMLWFVQRTALRALAREDAARAASGIG
ncbi:hypothetical protein ABZ832_13200 [Streptantibioticus parmotrematis]|uniref:hypothetical protein n=1 Tax=Streptantibioticus parmotrematis TaxID=2873249 RepID=UPI0033F4EFA9